MRKPGPAALLLLVACAPDAPSGAPSAAAPWPPFTVRGTWAPRSSLAYTVDGAGGPVPEAAFREVVARAAAAWSTTSAPALREVPADEPWDVRFAWGGAATDEDPSAPFGRDTSVARTGPVGPGCEVLFDRSRAWRLPAGLEPDGAAPAPGTPSLLQAATHETGHVLGLGHSPDPRALLHGQRELGVERPARPELAGVAALYGGAEPGPGALVVQGTAGTLVLPGVAPAGTDWDAVDTDGDGRAELVVWDASGAHQGAWMAYHFTVGPRLAETRGPHLGAVAPGGTLALEAAGSARLLVSTDPSSGRTVRLALDDRGALGPPSADAAPGEARPLGGREALSADLDGDGTPERVHREE